MNSKMLRIFKKYKVLLVVSSIFGHIPYFLLRRVSMQLCKRRMHSRVVITYWNLERKHSCHLMQSMPDDLGIRTDANSEPQQITSMSRDLE